MVKIQNRTKFLPLQTPEITFLMVKSELSRSKMSTNERFYKLKVNKIAARWPAKAVAQRFCSLPSFLFFNFIVPMFYRLQYSYSCAFNICA